MEDERLLIPYGLSMEQEYFPGFGSQELRQFLVGAAAAAAIGALLLVITGQLLALVAAVLIGTAGSMMAVRRDPYTRISVIGQIADMARFRKSQKCYRYTYESGI